MRARATFYRTLSVQGIVKATDILLRLSSRLILDIARLELVLLYIDTLKDILLAKLIVPSFYNTYCNIYYLIY